MTDDKPESVAARLIAELEGEAALVDVGSFDIDESRALDKLARFQLAQPRAYILRWAEAGLLAGATRLRFDVEGAMVRVSFDRRDQPVVLPATALRRLLSVLVSSAPVAEHDVPRALLVQLAVGVVAALSLEPRYCAIESIGGDGRGFRQRYGLDAPLVQLVDTEPGTRIYLVESARLNARVDGALGRRVEHELLRAHCRHAVTPIFLDGRRISQQPVLDNPIVAAPVFRNGIQIGTAGFVRSPAPARALLLSHGLLVEALTLNDCQRGFVAAVDVPLPRDLSQSSISRTPELDAALAPAYQVYHRLRAQLRPW